MKKFFFLLVAAILVGFSFFAFLHWLFLLDVANSAILACVAGITGIVIEYIKPLLRQKRQQ